MTNDNKQECEGFTRPVIDFLTRVYFIDIPFFNFYSAKLHLSKCRLIKSGWSNTSAVLVLTLLLTTLPSAAIPSIKSASKKSSVSSTYKISTNGEDSTENFPARAKFLMTNIFQAHYKKQQLEAVMAEETAVLNANPNIPAALTVRGFAEWRLDRYRGAQRDLEKTRALLPGIKNAIFYQILGECYLQDGACDKAVECFDKIIQYQPKYSVGYLRRCQTYLESKQYEKALPDANKVVELSHHENWALELRARINRLTGHYNEVADCTEGIKKAPNDSGLYDERSKSYLKLGKKDLAEKDKKTWEQFSQESLIDALGK
jgi:tetratricopeptide (TPR) repeat protein